MCSSHSTQCLSGCTWSAVSSSGPHYSKRHRQTEEGLKEVRKDYQRAEELPLWGNLEGVFPPWRRGGPHHSTLILKGWLQRGCGLSLHKESHRQGKGQGLQVAQEVLSWYKKKNIYIFTVRLVTGTTFPGRWWSPRHQRFSRSAWAGSQMISAGLPCAQNLMVFWAPCWPGLFDDALLLQNKWCSMMFHDCVPPKKGFLGVSDRCNEILFSPLFLPL